MTELMECDGDVHFTVAGISGRGLLALGHGDRDEILRVFDAYARASWGQVSVAGDRPLEPGDAERLVCTWVRPVADCGMSGNIKHGARDCEACQSPDWAGEYRIRHEHACWLCAAIKASPWWLVGLFDDPATNAGKAGWLPVTMWRDPADAAVELTWTTEPSIPDAA